MNREKYDFSRIHMLLAWGIIPLAYLAWCLFTVSYKADILAYAGGVAGEIAIVLYGVLADRLVKTKKETAKEITILNCLLIVVSLKLCCSVTTEFDKKFLPLVYLLIISVLVVAGVLVKKQLTGHKISEVTVWVKAHLGILAVLILTTFLAIDGEMYQFKWDGLLYYDAVKGASLNSVSSVALYGHVAIGSGAIYRFFAALFKDVATGMIIANIFILLMAVMAVYGIVKALVPEKKELWYCMAAACFSFSPFLMGMVNYFSTDWFCVCLVVILLYFIIKRQWTLTTIAACIFCLSKEPALIAYTGICFGMVVANLLEPGRFSEKFLKLFGKAHYYFMLIPYFLWFGTYKIMGQWNAGSGGFSLDAGYIIDKLKVLLIFNFNWIFTILIIAGIVIIIRAGKLADNLYWLMPMIMSNIFLMIFNVLFKTANHPRYIDSFVSVSIVIALVLTGLWLDEKKAVIATGVITVICLMACYFTFDPVSLLAFEHADTGNGQILYTANYPLGDGSVYNKQILHMERLYSEAIEDSLNDNSAIVIPAVSNSVYAVDGMSQTISLNEPSEKDVQYWDYSKNKRVPYVSEHIKQAKEINVYHIAGECMLDSIDCDSQLISVIYIKGINDYNYSDSYEKVDSIEYSYWGWVMTRDILKRK